MFEDKIRKEREREVAMKAIREKIAEIEGKAAEAREISNLAWANLPEIVPQTLEGAWAMIEALDLMLRTEQIEHSATRGNVQLLVEEVESLEVRFVAMLEVIKQLQENRHQEGEEWKWGFDQDADDDADNE